MSRECSNGPISIIPDQDGGHNQNINAQQKLYCRRHTVKLKQWFKHWQILIGQKITPWKHVFSSITTHTVIVLTPNIGAGRNIHLLLVLIP